MARTNTSAPGLEVLEKVEIDANVEPGQIALCDAHDLIAIANVGDASETAVTVYRLKGEVAFTVALREDEDSRLLSLRWKPDGSLLAVNWSDDVCCLYSGENGKLLYELPTRRASAGDDAGWTLDVNLQDFTGHGSDASVLGEEGTTLSAPIIWTAYDDGGKKQDGSQPSGHDATTDDFFETLNGDRGDNVKAAAGRADSPISDLVNAITTLDVTGVMPRLSKIETCTGMRHSPEGNKFNTQASTDTIFDASTFAPGIFSTLLTSDTNGCVTVFVDETIKVGHIQLPHAEQVRSASRQGCTSQVILARSTENPDHYHLNFIDLPLEQLGSPLNYVVSLNTRRLQSLMSYITHTVRCVHQEVQIGIKGVPARLLKLLEEDLAAAESTPHTAITAAIELQHLALTSTFHPVLLEWLKDIVKETGHKRWDQATNAMYDHIQSYIFKNLLPALQRFVAAVSALRGQARWHQHTGKFAVRLEVFEQLIQWADTLGLVAQRTLRAVTEEQAQFRAFSKWLRVMIDVAVAGPGTKGADETEEREAPNYDVDLVLRYIKGPLMRSMLQVLAESTPAAQGALLKQTFFGQPVVTAMSREATVQALQTLDRSPHELFVGLRSKPDIQPQPYDPINLPLLTCLLKAHTRIAIDEIHRWQAQAVPRSPDVTALGNLAGAGAMGQVYDMAVYPPSPGDGDTRDLVHILAGPAHEAEGDASRMTLLHVRRPQIPSAPARVDSERLAIPSLSPEGRHPRILHAALLADPDRRGPAEAVLVLASSAAETETADHALFLLTLGPCGDPQSGVLHTWHPSTSFLPSPDHFIVGGRPGKRVVVVFSSAGSGSASGGHSRGRGTKWEVLGLEGLDAVGGAGEDVGEDMEMEMEA